MKFCSLSFVTLIAIATAAPLNFNVQITLDSSYAVQSCQAFYDSPVAAFSCEATQTIPSTDLCCYETPNGVVMQTQFWDFNPDYADASTYSASTKTNSSSNPGDFVGLGTADQLFTIHGLWNDLCNGQYNTYCNNALNVQASDLQDIIVNKFGDLGLYNKMQQVWVSNSGSASSLWEHEYNKHGTCMTTIQPRCYTGEYQQYQTAYDFYRKVVEVWDSLPTYQFLENAGITPTLDKTYSLSDVQAALSQAHGAQVYVGCSNTDAISEIWYYNHVKGSVLTGIYKPIDTLTKSNCPADVRYLPKN